MGCQLPSRSRHPFWLLARSASASISAMLSTCSGKQQVVVAEVTDDLGARPFDGGAAMDLAVVRALRQVEEADPGVLPLQAGDDLAGVVADAVADHDDLDLGHGLLQRRADGEVEGGGMVVGRHQDRRDRAVGAHRSPAAGTDTPPYPPAPSRTTLAGFPTTTAPAGTSRTTTAPAPTIASGPMTTSGAQTAPAPTNAPRPIRTLPGEQAAGTEGRVVLDHVVMADRGAAIDVHEAADARRGAEHGGRVDHGALADRRRSARPSPSGRRAPGRRPGRGPSPRPRPRSDGPA